MAPGVSRDVSLARGTRRIPVPRCSSPCVWLGGAHRVYFTAWVIACFAVCSCTFGPEETKGCQRTDGTPCTSSSLFVDSWDIYEQAVSDGLMCHAEFGKVLGAALDAHARLSVRVLDLGHGDGRAFIAGLNASLAFSNARNRIHYQGVDLSSVACAAAQKNLADAGVKEASPIAWMNASHVLSELGWHLTPKHVSARLQQRSRICCSGLKAGTWELLTSSPGEFLQFLQVHTASGNFKLKTAVYVDELKVRFCSPACWQSTISLPSTSKGSSSMLTNR
jgi:hypothetical protein